MIKYQEKTWINFEDVRQFFYCKRKIYFRYCAKFKGYKSYKMTKGTEYHNYKFKRKEKWINEKKNFWVENEKLKVKGYVDYITKTTNNEILIGDYKQKYPYNGKIPEQYKMQLVIEALALQPKVDITKVEIKLPKGKKIQEKITVEEIKKAIEAVKEIRKIIKEEKIPEQTKIKNKCKDCECRNMCQPL